MVLTINDVNGLDQFLSQFQPELQSELQNSMLTELKSRRMNLLKFRNRNETADLNEVQREAHGLKGTALTFHLSELATDAEKVELYKGDTDILIRMTDDLTDKIQTMVLDIEKHWTL